jgi:phosphoglycerate dehydrogenase-like enzyme
MSDRLAVEGQLRIAAVSPSFCEHPILRERLLAAFPDAKLNTALDRLEGDGLVAFLQGADVAIVGLEHMTADVINALPDLKVISKLGTGLDMIDLEAMRARDIRLGWRAGANALSIAELVIGYAITALRKMNSSNLSVRSGQVVRNRMGRLLTGRVVGLQGCGHIGQHVVRLLQPFGCKILAYDPADRSEFYAQYGVEAVSFDELVERSEILSIHAPLNDRTRDLYNRALFARMRNDAILINTARGEIVDEEALFEALTTGVIEAACADVLCSEPNFDSPLIALPNFFLTPHIGGSAAEARLAMGEDALNGITNNFIPWGNADNPMGRKD